ncbi:MAG: hypothetical protein IKZ68_02450 [Bacilli bacterium]|nr:hypothetical protein [Bacilli bacterium]
MWVEYLARIQLSIGSAYVFQWWLGLIVTLVLVGGIVACGIVVSRRQKDAALRT